MSQPDTMRIQKFLSQAGHCSRRQAEKLVAAGHVTLNGEIAAVGAPVDPLSDKVEVDGKPITIEIEPVYIMLHKPVSVITTLDDPEGRPTVRKMLPRDIPRCWPVGRLDWDSEGLVLMTNDGALTHALTHPSTHVEKLYNLKLRGQLESADYGLQQMREGVTLDDGFQASSSQVTVESSTGKHTWIQIVLHEGRNRQLRRMAEAVGHTVLKLRRVAIGPLALGDMPPRRWRPLTKGEVLSLYTAANLQAPKHIQKHPDGPISWEKKVPKSKRKSTGSGKPGGKPRGKSGGRRSKSEEPSGGKPRRPDQRPTGGPPKGRGRKPSRGR